MAVDFTKDDTDVYSESIKEYSRQDEINKLVEWKRKNTLSAINANQKGLIPYFINPKWRKTKQYFENGSYRILRSYTKICLSIEGLANNDVFNRLDEKYFSLDMKEGYEKHIIAPFLLFINRVHIPWSTIKVIRSDDYTSLLISNIDCDIIVNQVDIIKLPFKTIYEESTDDNPLNEDPSKTLVFKFGSNGLYNQNNNIYVYADTEDIKVNSYGCDRYQDTDMMIPYTRKMTTDNLFVFDEHGYLDRDAKLKVKTTNLLTVDDSFLKFRYVVCCYNTKNNLNEDNTVRALNEPFEKALVDGSSGFKQLDFNAFLSDFDFNHDKTLPYQTNITNSLNYVFGYDENKLDKVFTDIKPMNIVQLDVNTLIRRYQNSNGTLSFLRERYQGDKKETYPIIFHNGMIPSYYDKLAYTPYSFSFKPVSDMYQMNGFDYRDTFEVAYVRNVHNTLYKLDNTKPNFLNITNCDIDKEDLVVYSACRGEYNLFPINYSIDANQNIVLKNPNYAQGQIYLGSRNQFIYERYVPAANTTIINLTTKFRSGYDEKKYMVFVNGRYLNSIYYRVLIPSMNNNKITKRALYLMKTITPSDRVDVFYCSTPKLNRVNFNGDLLIHCIKTKAIADGQKRFKVPYPYRNYPRDYDSFFCIKHSAYVDKEKYTIDGDYINFVGDEPYLDFGRDLIFVFPYYRPDWENDGDVDPNSIGNFITRSTQPTSDTRVITFPTSGDNLGDVTNKDSNYVFFNSTYIDPSRYDFTGPNQITIKDVVISTGTVVTMAIETDSTLLSTNDIVLDTVEVTATQDKQYLFNIPKTEYYDSFFVIRGSVLLDPVRYFITTENVLMLVNEDDYIFKGDTITFVFARDKNEDLNAGYTKHIKTEFMHYVCSDSTNAIHIPTNYYHRFRFNKSNMVLFSNSVYVDPSRYNIDGNNNITANADEIIFRAGSGITIMLAYKALNFKRVDGEIQNREIIYFDDRFTEIEADGQTQIRVPYPFVFTDTEFLLSKGDSILSNTAYTLSLDRKSIYYKDNSLKRGDQIRFTFVHNGGFTHISKKQVSIPISKYQTEVDIPSPYYKLVNLNNRMILTYGNLYLDKDRYMVDNQAKKILLLDIPNIGEVDGRELTFTFFFTGDEYNGAMAYLPQSGYVCFLRKDITHNFNKEMYMMFVNGRKVCKSELLDVSNNLVKVKTDIQRTYDLVVLDCAPTITELKNKYGTMSKWTNMLDPLPI